MLELKELGVKMQKFVSDDDLDAVSLSILEARGYRLRREQHAESGVEYDVAVSGSQEFWGISPSEVLGLTQVYQDRGESWRPNSGETKRFDEFNRDRARAEVKEITQQVVATILKPKTLTRVAVAAVSSGLRTFAMIGFAALYFTDHLNTASLLSWVTLPLSLFGIWKLCDFFEKAANQYTGASSR